MGAKSFSIKVPHNCPANLDIEWDTSLMTKAKVNTCSNPLVSSRKVVEKEMLEIFQRNPDRNIPVVANVVRAVQRKKNSHLIRKTQLCTLNGVKMLLNGIGVTFNLLFIQVQFAC
jgi:hypothetical protein